MERKAALVDQWSKLPVLDACANRHGTRLGIDLTWVILATEIWFSVLSAMLLKEWRAPSDFSVRAVPDDFLHFFD